MKKAIFLAIVVLLTASYSLHAQNKMGHIDITTLIMSMPEYKKADTILAQYQNALNQQYADMVNDFNERDAFFGSRDTVKFTKAQLEAKRNELAQLYSKIQNWNTQAQQMYADKENQVMTPIQTKAQNAIEAVAKENGYTYVFNRTALVVAPPAADDLLPLVKKKLGIK